MKRFGVHGSRFSWLVVLPGSLLTCSIAWAVYECDSEDTSCSTTGSVTQICSTSGEMALTPDVCELAGDEFAIVWAWQESSLGTGQNNISATIIDNAGNKDGTVDEQIVECYHTAQSLPVVDGFHVSTPTTKQSFVTAWHYRYYRGNWDVLVNVFLDGSWENAPQTSCAIPSVVGWNPNSSANSMAPAVVTNRDDEFWVIWRDITNDEIRGRFCDTASSTSTFSFASNCSESEYTLSTHDIGRGYSDDRTRAAFLGYDSNLASDLFVVIWMQHFPEDEAVMGRVFKWDGSSAATPVTDQFRVGPASGGYSHNQQYFDVAALPDSGSGYPRFVVAWRGDVDYSGCVDDFELSVLSVESDGTCTSDCAISDPPECHLPTVPELYDDCTDEDFDECDRVQAFTCGAANSNFLNVAYPYGSSEDNFKVSWMYEWDGGGESPVVREYDVDTCEPQTGDIKTDATGGWGAVSIAGDDDNSKTIEVHAQKCGEPPKTMCINASIFTW